MHRALVICLLCLLLSGCSNFLEREYSTAEPHSSKFWESEAAGTLRAENYQDVVNDLLILVGQHTETATLRLYHFTDDLAVSDTMEKAALEVKQETPLGAYAVQYITSSVQTQRSYYEVALHIDYRRSAEQLREIVNATSPEAVYSLLETALDAEKSELVVRFGYWEEGGQEKVENAVAQLREERALAETPEWTVSYYPTAEAAGLVEILLTMPDAQMSGGENLSAPT